MTDVATSAELREHSFNAFVTHFFETQFPSGNVPIVVSDFVGLSTTIFAQTTNLARLITSYASGDSFASAFKPLAETLAGIGLTANVAAGALRLHDALDAGNQADIDTAAGRLFSGIAGALVLGLGARAFGVPAIGFMSLGYFFGSQLYNNADLIGNLLGPYVDALPNLPDWMGDDLAQLQGLLSPLMNVIHDPLILDLDGDGIELTPLANSTVHFDYNNDGFAEQTGWVSADDGLLVRDENGDGVVNGVSELFGSSTQDGFAVLETMDSNGDGKIDEKDDSFNQLRIWTDLNQNGTADAGELNTLADLGIQSISLNRVDINGTNQGHTVGYEAGFTRTDQSHGSAQTIYFQTDSQDSIVDNTPPFIPGPGVLELPQLPGSGQILSIASKATLDAAFLANWTELSDTVDHRTKNLARDGLGGTAYVCLCRAAQNGQRRRIVTGSADGCHGVLQSQPTSALMRLGLNKKLGLHAPALLCIGFSICNYKPRFYEGEVNIM